MFEKLLIIVQINTITTLSNYSSNLFQSGHTEELNKIAGLFNIRPNF